ncbi:hypothetical protein ACIQU6_30735 [Streptomyces sp. NPDC090442]|uniref:hypothetical protein n=1 Tax=Streptomyces sp. NPDC090442 TaxID=3365962 RepID=UPI00381C3C2E
MLNQDTTPETPTGAIVHITKNDVFYGIPTGTAIIVGDYDGAGEPMTLAWFWALGPITPGRTAVAVFAENIEPQPAQTLLTLPEGDFRAIREGVRDAIAQDPTLAEELEPLTRAVQDAAAQRD